MNSGLAVCFPWFPPCPALSYPAPSHWQASPTPHPCNIAFIADWPEPTVCLWPVIVDWPEPLVFGQCLGLSIES